MAERGRKMKLEKYEKKGWYGMEDVIYTIKDTEGDNKRFFIEVSKKNQYFSFNLQDEEIPIIREECLRLIKEEKQKLSPLSFGQEILTKMEKIIQEVVITNVEKRKKEEEEETKKKEEEARRRAEEIERKTRNLLEWSSSLRKYKEELLKELARIEEILVREPVIENYDWYKEGYYQRRMEYPSEDDC